MKSWMEFLKETLFCLFSFFNKGWRQEEPIVFWLEKEREVQRSGDLLVWLSWNFGGLKKTNSTEEERKNRTDVKNFVYPLLESRFFLWSTSKRCGKKNIEVEKGVWIVGMNRFDLFFLSLFLFNFGFPLHNAPRLTEWKKVKKKDEGFGGTFNEIKKKPSLL